jgi:hypothetical protein
LEKVCFDEQKPISKEIIIYIKKFLKKKLIIDKPISILVPCKEYQSKPLPSVSNLAKQSLKQSNQLINLQLP